MQFRRLNFGFIYTVVVTVTDKNTFGDNEYVEVFCERYNSEVERELSSSDVRKLTKTAHGNAASVKTKSLKKYNSAINLLSELLIQMVKSEGAFDEKRAKISRSTISDESSESAHALQVGATSCGVAQTHVSTDAHQARIKNFIGLMELVRKFIL